MRGTSLGPIRSWVLFVHGSVQCNPSGLLNFWVSTTVTITITEREKDIMTLSAIQRLYLLASRGRERERE
jgi:hypothetical protein